MDNFPSNIIQDNIYSKILDKEYLNYKFNQIVLGTKNLVTNNNSFKDFSKEYEDVTKLTTFKIPDEDYFPLLRNKEFVSLGRNQYKYDSRKKKAKKLKILTKLFKSSKRPKFSLSDKNIINSKNNHKSINSFNNQYNLILSPIQKKSRSQKKLISDIKINYDINNIKTIFKRNNSLNKNNLKIVYNDNYPSIFSNNQEIKSIEDNKFDSKFENLSYILRNSNAFKDNKEDNLDDKYNVFHQTFTSKIKISHSQTLINSNFKNLRRNSIKKKIINDIYKIINVYTTEYNFYKSQESLNVLFNSKNRNIFKNKYKYNKNSYEFIWLTSAYQYIVTVRTPEISFKICEIEIKKNIDIELLFFLIENNFKDWHFYIMEYLFSFKDFCLIINNFFSVYKTSNIHNLKLIHDYKNNNNVIYLSKEKKSIYSKKNSKLEYILII